jgi:hypothetical protein
MKNIILLITALLFSFITSSQGQVIEELAEEAADGLCNCVNEAYGDIDNDVKRAMARIIKYQTQEDLEGMESYMANLSVDLISRIAAQAGIFEENEDLFQLCLDDMEQELGELSFEEEQYEGITEDKFLIMMVESMKEATGCEFAYILMELGLQMEAEENKDQVKTEPVKPKTSAKGSNEGTNKFEGTGGN